MTHFFCLFFYIPPLEVSKRPIACIHAPFRSFRSVKRGITLDAYKTAKRRSSINDMTV